MSKTTRAERLARRNGSETERVMVMLRLVRSHEALMVRVVKLEQSLDFWRNMQTAAFFARGMGNEMLMTDCALSVQKNRELMGLTEEDCSQPQ